MIGEMDVIDLANRVEGTIVGDFDEGIKVIGTCPLPLKEVL